MKVNPEYLSFAVHQSNSGMPFFVAGGVILIITLCLSVLVGVKLQVSLAADVLVFVAGAVLAATVFGCGSFINGQVKGNIQEIETATGAQIISIGDSTAQSDTIGDYYDHTNIIIGRNDNPVNLTKNVSYIKHGKVYTNGVIVITHDKAGLFDNEEEMKPILAKK